MKQFALTLIAIIASASFALAAQPAKLGFRGYSSAGVTNYATTCTVAGVIKTDGADRIIPATARTFSLSKGGFKNYSTALHTITVDTAGLPKPFYVSCVKTLTGDAFQVRMFFDGDETKYFPISKEVFRLY